MFGIVLLALISVQDTASESTLKATERILEREQELGRRVPLLLRWMTLTYEVLGADKKAEADIIVYDRLKNEIANLQKRAQGEELDPLLRQYAWRQASEKKWTEAIKAFQGMKRRMPKDELVFGDSLLASGLSAIALEALEKAKQGLPALASYKMAWAYLQMNDNIRALKEFDSALKLPAEVEGDIRVQAFQERIIPYVAVYSKSSFTGVEVSEFKTLAAQVFVADSASIEPELKNALKKVIEGFLGKGETTLARQALDQLIQIAPDQNDFSLSTAPLWLGIYRAKLQHSEVLKILESLPSQAIEAASNAKLLEELQKTAAFYERLVSEDNKTEMKPVLQATYDKTIQLFPGGAELLAQRVNAAKLAWDRGDIDKCLEYMAPVSREEKQVADTGRLYAQCRLKRLDDWRTKKNPDLIQELKVALVEERLYRFFETNQSKTLFEGLLRILLSEISKDRNSETLNLILQMVLREYPFENTSTLYRDAKAVEAQNKFVSLGTKQGFEAGDEYFGLFLESDQFSETGQKALANSILLASTATLPERCDKWIELQGLKVKSDDALWIRCYRGAEESFDLARMNAYLSTAEKSLTEEQRIRLGLIELALGKQEGQSRLQKIKSKSAEQALQAWVGPKGFVPEFSKVAKEILIEVQDFHGDLKPMKRAQWEARISQHIKRWEALDQKISKALIKEDGRMAADLLYARVSMTSSLLNWIKKVPRPLFRTKGDAKAFDDQMTEVASVWQGQVDERQKECSQKAYYLSRDFTPANSELCPEEMTEADLEIALRSWRERSVPSDSTLHSDPQQEFALKMMSHAGTTASDLVAKYWLLASLDFLKHSEDRAKALESLAERSKNSVYWEMALALNPHSLKALEGFKRAVKINGVQERIVDAKIKHLQQTN